jgi:uncharacterized protein YjiS (DUF1127 family)
MVRFTETEQEMVAQAKAAGTPAALTEQSPTTKPSLFANFLSFVQRRQTEAMLSRLDDHLREDIGLNPIGNRPGKFSNINLPYAY